MKLIGACIKKTAGVTKACVFEKVLFQIAYTTSVVVRMVGIDGRALARDYSLRPVLG